MKVVVTVTATPESPDEIGTSFPEQFQNMRTHFEMLRTEEAFGPPEKVQLRYAAIGGQAAGSAE